jgi:serine/threonine protein kinase
MTLSPGQVLNNRYRIVKLLGQGGFGAVYRAWDMNLDFPRALKENLDTSSESQKQFKREAQILTGLTHPNLPRVIDHFIIPEQGQYLVMDYVEGQDLQEMLLQRNGPLPEAQVVGWIEQICSALEYLHAQNPPVVHRDIKPANIKITPQSKAMLVDFGIAKASEAGHATTIGAKAVTPGYSPIEQYGMGGHTGPRTDIYALGATMYALLTGQPPVESTLRVGRDPLTPTGQLNPEISPPVTVAIQKAMQVDAEQRYQSAGEFASALRSTAPIPAPGPSQPATFQPTQAVTAQFSSPPAAPPIQSTPEPTSNPASSRRWLWLAGLGLVALLAIGYIYIANANAMWPFAEQVVATSTQAATATQADQSSTDCSAAHCTSCIQSLPGHRHWRHRRQVFQRHSLEGCHRCPAKVRD